MTIPVALAIAEKMGGVSGRELIAAVAAGTDVMTRITQAIDVPDWTMTEGWFATQLFGFIAGAVTAGRLHAPRRRAEWRTPSASASTR